MAQVSGSSDSSQNLLNALQSRRQDVSAGNKADRPEEKQGQEKANRADALQASEEGSRTRTSEEQVLLQRETQQTSRETRNQNGSRNDDNLVAPTERAERERGAAEVIVEREETNARGARGFEDASQGIEAQDASRRDRQTRTETSDAAPSADSRREETVREVSLAPDPSSSQRLREFETQGQERIEPQQVNETVREESARTEQEAANREPTLETQTVVQAGPSGLESQTRVDETVSDGSGKTKDNPEAPDPASVQSERGQNIDDLV